ncbi:hypothetical protein PFISCL1PPCAC_21800, partial [Pristionchus fissidentatus]
LFQVDQGREGRDTNHNLEVVLLTVMRRCNEELIEKRKDDSREETPDSSNFRVIRLNDME